jgi:hypothetical protein
VLNRRYRKLPCFSNMLSGQSCQCIAREALLKFIVKLVTDNEVFSGVVFNGLQCVLIYRERVTFPSLLAFFLRILRNACY